MKRFAQIIFQHKFFGLPPGFSCIVILTLLLQKKSVLNSICVMKCIFFGIERFIMHRPIFAHRYISIRIYENKYTSIFKKDLGCI